MKFEFDLQMTSPNLTTPGPDPGSPIDISCFEYLLVNEC